MLGVRRKEYTDFPIIYHCGLPDIVTRDVRFLADKQLQYAEYLAPAG